MSPDYISMDEYQEILLPITEQGFDEIVEEVVRRYNLTDKTHAAALISHAVRHTPNDTATTTLRRLGHFVLKNLANYVAQQKSEQLRHEGQVVALVQQIKKDPNDMQAWDELRKIADAGWDKAKEALTTLEKQAEETANSFQEPVSNVLPIQGV